MLTQWQFKNSIDGMFVRVINGFKAICTQSYSADPQDQDIAVRIEMYDGGLDVPNEDVPT